MNKIIPVLFFSLLISFVSFSQDFIPTETEALLECIVTDPDKIPEEGAEVLVESVDKTFSKQGITGIDGKFRLLAPEGNKYTIQVKKFGKTFHFNLELPVLEGPSEFTQPLRIKLVKFYVRGYTLDHLYFDIGKWDIKPGFITTLNKLYDSFQKNPKLIVEIAGYTDNVGDDIANQLLSQRRADSIRSYLIQKGISENRILAKGYGEKSPIASNNSDAGRAKNRRTEVKVIEE